MCNTIREFIVKNTHKYCNINTNQYNINIIDYNTTQEDIDKFVARVKWFIKIAKVSQPVTIWWFPTPFKKIFPAKDSRIDVEHVNSAVTQFYRNTSMNFICIFRREEAHKVLFHEMVHFYNFDKNVDSMNEYYRNYYGFNGQIPFYLSETYAEIVALLLNIIYLHGTTKFNYYLNIERAYSVHILQRMFSHYNITSIDQLDKLDTPTNIATYFVVKTDILLDKKIEFFLEKLLKNGLELTTPFFASFLTKQLDVVFSSEKIDLPTNTLRMTILE